MLKVYGVDINNEILIVLGDRQPINIFYRNFVYLQRKKQFFR